MDPRMGRRSSNHDQVEPDIVSPEAARVSGRNLPGLRGQRQGPIYFSGSARSHGPNRAGGARRGNGFEGMYRNGEAEAPRGHQSHSSRPFDSEDIEAPFGGRHFAGGRLHDFTERNDEREDRAGPHRHSQPRGDRRDFFRQQNAFGDHGVRPSQQHDTGTRRRPVLQEEIPYADPIGARPCRQRSASQGPTSRRPMSQRPMSQRHGFDTLGRESSQDNERYGDSRRGGGNRARDRSEEAYGEHHAGLSRAPDRGRGAKSDNELQEEKGRFIPYTFRMLHSHHVEILAKVFKVRTSKVKEWCEQDFIRIDTKRGNQINIDPLLSSLPSKDREMYERTLQKLRNEREIEKVTGWGPRHIPTAYERGFYAGQASVHHERRTGWRR